MGTTVNSLYGTLALPATETSVVAPTSGRVLLDKLTSYATAAGDVTLRIIPVAGSAGATNILAKKTFALGESYTWPEITGHTLTTGEVLSALGSVASAVNLRVSGRVVT